MALSKGESTSQDGGTQGTGGAQAKAHLGGTNQDKPSLGGDGHGSGGQAKGSDVKPKVGFSKDESNPQVPIGDGVEHLPQILPECGTGHASEHPNQQQSDDTQRANDNSDGERQDDKRIELTASERLFYDPVAFCQSFCSSHESYSTEQRDFLKSCRVVSEQGEIRLADWPKSIALAAVNGFGKTELIADAIRYWLNTIPGCVIPFTSKVYRQCEMLESYLQTQQHKFPGWKLIRGRLTAPNGNYCRWFSTDNPGAIESFHAPFLIRVGDEMKSQDDETIDATNRWQPKLTVWISSKGLQRGRFYECFTKNRERWILHEVDAYKCPWISERWIEEQMAEHTASSSLIKSMILNQWNDVDIRNLISLDDINRCIAYPPVKMWNEVATAGVDPSAAKKGGDEFVIVHRKGNQVFDPIVLKGYSSPLEAVGACIRILKEHQIKVVNLDNGNMGQLILPIFEQQLKGDSSIVINGINFGGKPISTYERHANRATEMWVNMAQKIAKREIVLPNDDKLIEQLSTRETEDMIDGKIRLVSKQIMKKYGIASPDRADALALCLVSGEAYKPHKTYNDDNDDRDLNDFDLSKHKHYTTADGKFDLGGY